MVYDMPFLAAILQLIKTLDGVFGSDRLLLGNDSTVMLDCRVMTMRDTTCQLSGTELVTQCPWCSISLWNSKGYD